MLTSAVPAKLINKYGGGLWGVSFKKHTIEKIASHIPGYAGYKEKEVRRETDALFRRHIASILSSAAAQLVLSPTDARAVEVFESKRMSALC